MKTLFAFMFIFSIPVWSQIGSVKEDTITSGNGNEYHPAFSRTYFHSSYIEPGEWLVFERQTEDSSYIVAKQIITAEARWDSNEVIISRSPVAGSQSRPDIAWGQMHGMIAWQKRIEGKWNIFGSTYSPNTQAWSAPFPLTDDTLDNENVRLRVASSDSIFIAAWQNHNILRIRAYPSVIGVDTIAVSNDDSTEFDLTTSWGSFINSAIVYTFKAGNIRSLASVEFKLSPEFSILERDTLRPNMSGGHPRFIQGYTNQIFFESMEMNNPWKNIYSSFALNSYPLLLTEAGSDESYRNAQLYESPRVTGVNPSARSLPEYMVLIAEGYKTNGPAKPSSIIFMQGWRKDTISTTEDNRNPALGSIAFRYGKVPNILFPAVWESNRTGKSHLYGTLFVPFRLLGIEPKVLSAPQFALMQNYPNPFNPSTTIGYELARTSHVTLKVFNVLGEEVATLLNETQFAGVHQCQFSTEANRLPSGVYFYRLQAGDFMQTRSMIVLK